MIVHTLPSRWAAAAAVALLPTAAALAAPPAYTVTDLGLPAGYVDAGAADLNDRGQVLGMVSPVNGMSRPFIWSAEAGMKVAGPEKHTVHRDIGAINKHGHVVGSRNCHTCPHGEGFVWVANGQTQSLQGLYPGADATARGINDDDVVVGSSYAEHALHHAVTWSAADGLVDRHPAGTYSSQGVAINNRGQITGHVTPVRQAYATGMVIEPDGSWISLGGLFDDGACCGSYPRAINRLGHVVGAASLPQDYHTRAFIWTPAGGMRAMGAGGPYATWYSDATDINGQGQAVGMMYTAANDFTGFYWDKSSGMHNLNDLVATTDPWAGRLLIESARSINHAGQIAVNGKADGVRRVFLLTPVP
jgi:probable HAF family extracellular repeat protein